MKTLILKDLPLASDLDRAAMASVHGGMSCGPTPPAYGCAPSYPAPQASLSKNDFSFNAAQSLCQDQNTMVNNGNNVAFACGISSNVQPCQTGTNTINFGK
jgi:hypothetical protein